jgi:hypothetical protein
MQRMNDTGSYRFFLRLAGNLGAENLRRYAFKPLFIAY